MQFKVPIERLTVTDMDIDVPSTIFHIYLQYYTLREWEHETFIIMMLQIVIDG